MSATKTKQKTITRADLVRLARTNSDDLPSPVSLDGRRMRFVGIG